jgi:hypothetical protein
MKSQELIRMCHQGKAKEARKHVLELMDKGQGNGTISDKMLLDTLFYIENHLGETRRALNVLEKRRSLGYRSTDQKFDAALQAATLLYRSNRLFDARSELIKVLRDRRSLKWTGLLAALSQYIQIDEECAELMSGVLMEACPVAIGRFGITLNCGNTQRQLASSIKTAHRIFQHESRAYSALYTKALTDQTKNGRRNVVKRLRRMAQEAKVEFFRSQASALLQKLGVV